MTAPLNPAVAGRQSPSAGWLFVAAASTAVAAATWVLTDRSLVSLAVSVVSVGGAGLAVWLVPRQPGAAFGVLLLLAAASGVTLELPPGTMRLEQPGILAVGLAILLGRGTRIDRPMPIVFAIGLSALAYVAVLAASSALQAPLPLKSLLVTAWTGLSMIGGVLAYILVTREPAAGARWLLVAGLVTAAAAVACGLLYWLFGPEFRFAIQGAFGPMPKVIAFAWEPNLLASFLAATMPFAAVLVFARPTRRHVAMLALILLAIAFAMTRGAYLGMAAGIVALLGLVAWRTRAFRRVAQIGLLIVVLTAATIGVYAVTMPHPGIAGELIPVGSGSPGPSAEPGPAQPYPDTIGFRLARIPVAMRELARSPLIGLGAASFGQRHVLDPTHPDVGDHIAILAIAALYESGVVGAMALALVFVLIAVLLWRALRTAAAQDDAVITAAYAAALVTLLVAYQATNAIHFAVNWLLIGAALAWSVALVRRRTGHAAT